jgi:hypothetical protein
MKDSVGQDKKEQKQRSTRDETREPVVLYQTGSVTRCRSSSVLTKLKHGFESRWDYHH